jgi:methylenetetrahydrofolate reductase (NADPH)
MKVHAGAAFAVTQVGWDVRSWDELIRWVSQRGRRIPLVAAVYILSRRVARLFHADRVPGIRLPTALLERVEQAAERPDGGRGQLLDLAAQQVAVARGLGYSGVYLAGQRSATEVATVLELADGYLAADWRTLAAAISYPDGEPSRLFEPGDAPWQASDHPRPLTRPGGRAPLSYQLNRLVHDHLFSPGSAGFERGRRFYDRVESLGLGRPLHVLEQAAKIPLFGCHDCGDCSLPEIAYLCPESQCVKNQRNGPCGGSLAGECEVPGRPCIWASAYDRLAPSGTALSMLDRPPALQDHALRGTSAWANTFLGRDHYRHGHGPEPDAAGP